MADRVPSASGESEGESVVAKGDGSHSAPSEGVAHPTNAHLIGTSAGNPKRLRRITLTSTDPPEPLVAIPEVTDDDLAFFDREELRDMLFFPRKNTRVDTLPGERVFEGADGTKLVCSMVRARKSDSPMLLVHFHGNGELVESYAVAESINPDLYPTFRDQLSDAGMDTLFVEYRGYGASGGDVNLLWALDDVRAVFEQLDHPLERVIVFGRSLGSLFAIRAIQLYPEIAGIVIESGLSDPEWMIRRRIKEDTLEEFEAALGRSVEDACAVFGTHMNHNDTLTRFPGQVMVMHTADDKVIPVEQAWNNFNASPQPRIEPVEVAAGEENTFEVFKTDDGVRTLLIFAGGGHNYIHALNSAAYASALVDFFVSCGHSLPTKGSSCAVQ